MERVHGSRSIWVNCSSYLPVCNIVEPKRCMARAIVTTQSVSVLLVVCGVEYVIAQQGISIIIIA